MEGQVTVTSAKGWAKKTKIKTEIITLPSGANVEIARTQMKALLMADLMPMSLLANTTGNESEEAPELKAEESMAVAKGLKKISRLIQKAVIRPKIIFDGDPGNGEISADDIPADDLEFLMSYVLRTGEAEELKSFRNGRPGVNAGSPVQALPPAAIDNSGSG